MPLNLEFKARVSDHSKIRALLEKINAKYVETILQVDTYFNIRNGRLKIREINDSTAQLIYYVRDEKEEFRWSDYQIYSLTNVAVLKDILTKAIGLKGMVEKKRDVYLVENCRIHLDDVNQLGKFIEFEYVFDGRKGAEVMEFVEHLKSELSTYILQIHRESYIDLLLKRKR